MLEEYTCKGQLLYIIQGFRHSGAEKCTLRLDWQTSHPAISRSDKEDKGKKQYFHLSFCLHEENKMSLTADSVQGTAQV